MYSEDDAILLEKPGGDHKCDSEFEVLSDSDLSTSFCSTTESEMSNTFLDEAVMGHYEGWTREHNRWLGRWVQDDQMKGLLYSMQAFKFLDLQTFLSRPTLTFEPEQFAKGTKILDEFLADAQLDIVTKDRRFPGEAHHFVDEAKWTKIINDLYTALKYIQQPDMDIIRFYNLWIKAIVPGITENLPERITREKFESEHGLSWSDPSLESAVTCSTEHDSTEANGPGREDLVDLAGKPQKVKDAGAISVSEDDSDDANSKEEDLGSKDV